MNDTLIEQIQADAAALDIKITAQEIALYLSEKKVPPEHLEAIKRFIAFLRKNFDYPEKPLKYKHIRRISD